MNTKEVNTLKKVEALLEQLIAASAVAATQPAVQTKPGGAKRHRLTQAELAALPPVADAAGIELRPGQKVKCPDGQRGKVIRVDRRSRRVVVERAEDTKMIVASRVIITSGVRAKEAAAA